MPANRRLDALIRGGNAPIARGRCVMEALEPRVLLSAALLSDINAGGGSSSPQSIVAINGTVFFSANDGADGVELWKSDGTQAGTVMVKDIETGSGSSNPANLTNVNGTLFFSAYDSTNSIELWKSDGTTAGTVMVKDINPGVGGSFPGYLTNVNGTLFFSAYDSTDGYELWKSDGTTAGTVLVNDINPGTGGSNVSELTNVNGTLFFNANDGSHGYELWKSNGTTAGTVLVKDIRIGGSSSSPDNLINVNGRLFFAADNGTNGVELWKSDGTAAGTVMARNVNPSGSSNPQNMAAVNGTLFFSATDGAHGYELWKSDGTSAGTVMVQDINPGGSSSNAAALADINGTLFFNASDGAHGYELWKSDGTSAGTVMVKDINPGAGSSGPSYLTNVNGALFFIANDGSHGYELWKSDGTSAGTFLIKDIYSGSTGSAPSFLTGSNGGVFFGATDATHGQELWAVQPPTASAGAYTVDQQGQVTLSPVVSNPDPSDPLTYQWDFDGDGIYGEAGSAALRGDEVGPAPTFNASGLSVGTYPIHLRVADSAGMSASSSGTVTVKPLPLLVLAAGSGAGPQVRVLRGDQPELSFFAFDPAFGGGSDVAVGDVTGDGVGDIIVGAGDGGSSHVRIFSGIDATQIPGPLGSFWAFPGPDGGQSGAFNGPIHVAAGDVNGDGHADVIVSVGAHGPPHVKIFSGADGSLLESFLAFPNTHHTDPADPAYFSEAFDGGVNAAAGDIDHDGKADLIVAAGPGAGPHVKVFADGQFSGLIRSFYAYDAAFAGGVNVSAGDVNADGTSDILTTPQSDGGPEVKAFSGLDNSQLLSFWAYDPAYRGGVHLAAGDYDGDGKLDLFAAPAAGVAADLRRFSFTSGIPSATDDFFAFAQGFLGGVSPALTAS